MGNMPKSLRKMCNVTLDESLIEVHNESTRSYSVQTVARPRWMQPRGARQAGVLARPSRLPTQGGTDASPRSANRESGAGERDRRSSPESGP